MPTNKELEKIVEDQQKQIDALMERMENQSKETTLEGLLKSIKTGDPTTPLPPDDKTPFKRADRVEDGGWVVQCPNEEFWGDVCMTRFQGGVAIVGSDREGADFIVQQLEHDFGYKVLAVDDATISQVLKDLSAKKRPEPELAAKLAGGLQ